MTLLLKSFDDPRDALEKMTRGELAKFGKSCGITVNEEMPAILIRKDLRSRGLSSKARQWMATNVAPRVLGAKNGGAVSTDVPEADVNQANMDDDLARQWKAQQPSSLTPEQMAAISQPAAERAQDLRADVIDMLDMASLRKACKAKGIQMARTDNMQSLREKLKRG